MGRRKAGAYQYPRSYYNVFLQASYARDKALREDVASAGEDDDGGDRDD